MRTETTRLFKDLLFLQGHVADARLGADLATEAASPTPGTSTEESTMNLFKSFWLLGGLESIDPRIGDVALQEQQVLEEAGGLGAHDRLHCLSGIEDRRMLRR